ncbi:hypothetical protein QTP81_13095 [Alteromonas sp. ASW11-36]|uniref:Uncharacterized protein n=1 Tax=Alteromonas arenosi TaxID=3055817 RepID=A0ABT7SZB7_9ALTE|nr:hypothetical protein [Alteromonas sp. ASW11-36]MDM7861532.1 hypothetical protein [Alteromonas sp. ASW11-36]
MFKTRIFTLLVAIVVLSGCVSTQEMITVDEASLSNNEVVVGIILTEAPLAETFYTGSIGLLDYAIIAGVNSTLDKHLNSLVFDDYPKIAQQLQTVLHNKGVNTLLIETPIALKEAEKLKRPSKGKSKTSFVGYQEKYNIDYLLLVHLQQVGTTRSYYGPVPTSEPVATVAMSGQIIDLATHDLKWFYDASSQQVIETPWDESEVQFPNLTTAIYQALETSTRELVGSLEGNPKNKVAAQQVASGQ